MGAIVNTSLKKQFIIAACLYLGQLLVGFTMGWTAPVLVKLQNEDETPLDHIISDAEASWILSFIFLGTIIGPYLSAYLYNVIGRKPCLFIGGGIVLSGNISLALAKHIIVIFVGRFLSGVGNGIIFVTNLVYIGEFASSRIRGTLLSLTGFFHTLGTLVAYSIGPFLPYASVCWFGVALNGLYIVAVVLFVSETAVYLVMKDKRTEAMDNLASLGRQDDIDEIVAKANEKPKSNIDQLTEMYTVRSNRRATFIIIVLNIMQQSSGVIAVSAFVTIIFDMTGSNMESHVSTIIIGVTQVVSATIAPLLIDRTGRKSLLLVSTAVCSLSLATLGTFFFLHVNNYPIAKDIQWLSLVSLMIFFIAYFAGLGIIPNTYIGEMFTDTCRGFGGTFTSTISWLYGFGVSTAFGYMLPAWGPAAVFWIFSGACAFAFVFSVIFVPETKGKSLLEIREILSKSWI
ncbi:hypothetical protein PYW08_009798 [Mythimna loreyi]|uniref:Uncharacterized protein n=1 Tax=Mythimna loreyi TaxID=667449 RepID=A0ACC2Q6Z4_9NEOP|nr:hypothetical protein PYW08_009798 [Mythimna loreyi]